MNRMGQTQSKMLKLFPYLLIIAGILLLISGLIVFIFEREAFANSIKDIGLGIINVILGIFIIKSKQTQKINWKEIPLGFKILIVYFLISVLSNLINLPKYVNQLNFILGIIVNPPLSAFLSLFYLIIPLIIVLAIFSRTGWKLILGLVSFNLLNIIFFSAWFLLTPLTKIFTTMNKTLPNLPADSLQDVLFSIKLISLIPVFIGIIVGLAILVYVYKNKEYFSNDK